MNNIRQLKISEYISGKQYASIDELKGVCPGVSLMTLHRDLDALARDGAIIKIRGGVRVMAQPGDPSFHSREYENIGAKQLIAEKAAGLIREGGSVFFDAGTTTLAAIRAMPDIKLSIFTNGANFGNELQRFSNAAVYMCCGALNRSNMALSGQSTLEYLDGINIDLCFIGVSGYSIESGFTCGKESEMLVKKLAIKKARKSVVLMDSTKIGRLTPYTFAVFSDIDFVVGDGALPPSFASSAKKSGVEVL